MRGREGMENFVGGVKMSTTKVSIVLFADDVMLLYSREKGRHGDNFEGIEESNE